MIHETSRTVVDILRHGEPCGGRRFRGSLDDPLSELGWRQMWDAVGGKQYPWDIIVSSPLRRCAEFAGALASRSDLDITIEPSMREMSFGSWEGRSAAEVFADSAGELQGFWSDPVNNTPPNGEPLVDFRDRVLSAWQRLLDDHHGSRVLLVAHGGVLRMLVGHVLQMPLTHLYRMHVPYAAVSRVRIFGSGMEAQPQLVFHAGKL